MCSRTSSSEVYLGACSRLHVVPSRQICERLGEQLLPLNHLNLAGHGVTALSVALVVSWVRPFYCDNLDYGSADGILSFPTKKKKIWKIVNFKELCPILTLKCRFWRSCNSPKSELNGVTVLTSYWISHTSPLESLTRFNLTVGIDALRSRFLSVCEFEHNRYFY